MQVFFKPQEECIADKFVLPLGNNIFLVRNSIVDLLKGSENQGFINRPKASGYDPHEYLSFRRQQFARVKASIPRSSNLSFAEETKLEARLHNPGNILLRRELLNNLTLLKDVLKHELTHKELLFGETTVGDLNVQGISLPEQVGWDLNSIYPEDKKIWDLIKLGFESIYCYLDEDFSTIFGDAKYDLSFMGEGSEDEFWAQITCESKGFNKQDLWGEIRSYINLVVDEYFSPERPPDHKFWANLAVAHWLMHNYVIPRVEEQIKDSFPKICKIAEKYSSEVPDEQRVDLLS